MRNLILQAAAQAQGAQGASTAQTIQRTTQNPGGDYVLLKAREKELKNQLEDVQDRRNQLASQADEASGPAKAGLESRVAVLDQRLANIESDLTVVGRGLAATAPVPIAAPPPRT